MASYDLIGFGLIGLEFFYIFLSVYFSNEDAQSASHFADTIHSNQYFNIL